MADASIGNVDQDIVRPEIAALDFRGLERLVWSAGAARLDCDHAPQLPTSIAIISPSTASALSRRVHKLRGPWPICQNLKVWFLGRCDGTLPIGLSSRP